MNTVEKPSGCYPPVSIPSGEGPESGIEGNDGPPDHQKQKKEKIGTIFIAIIACTSVLALLLVAGGATLFGKRRCRKYSTNIRDEPSSPPFVAKEAKNAIEDRSLLSGTSKGKKILLKMQCRYLKQGCTCPKHPLTDIQIVPYLSIDNPRVSSV